MTYLSHVRFEGLIHKARLMRVLRSTARVSYTRNVLHERPKPY